MGKEEYVLRHNYRVFTKQTCEVLIKNEDKWKKEVREVVIPVDGFEGNQDPYVFHDPWFYGYCHNAEVSKDAGNQSILLWGAWNKKTDRYLIDTVFVVDKKYNWLGEKKGFEPSDQFKKDYQYENDDNLYKDFLCHRVNSDEHLELQFNGAKSIFAGQHLETEDNDWYRMPTKRRDKFHSCIPLKHEDGIYKLIDVFGIINGKDPNFLGKMKKRNQGGVWNIGDIRNNPYAPYVLDIMKHIYNDANILVTKVISNNSPNKIDVDLQKQYWPLIYGLEFDENKL